MTTVRATREPLPGNLLALLMLLGISVFLNYIDRGNLSIAAPMVKMSCKFPPLSSEFCSPLSSGHTPVCSLFLADWSIGSTLTG